MNKFDGKVALVTGAGSGIGQATALSFAKQGAKVVVSDLNEAGGNETVKMITDAGGEAVFVKANVAKSEDAQAMVAKAVQAFGRLDIGVNNAGIAGESVPTGEVTEEGWQRVIDVNLTGVFLSMKFEIQQMLKNGGGAIVNMASMLGSTGFATASAYVAAKHGVVGLTKNAALEYSAQGIRINSVGPGFIRTPLLQLPDEVMAQLTALTPIGRLGQPEEVAALVTFLASDDASFITGSYHLVDGAYTAQ